MNNKTSANSAQMTAFSVTTIGELISGRGSSLGRDIRYVLNVKTVGNDGQVVEGVRYTVNCAIDDRSMISFTGLGEEQISTAAGENFSIYGFVDSDGSASAYMNANLSVFLRSNSGVGLQTGYSMGRLCRWAPPRIHLSDDRQHWWLTSHTEWAGEGTPGYWNWSPNVGEARLNIPSKSIVTTRFTSVVQEGDNSSVRVDFPFDKKVFTEGERVRVLMPSSSAPYTDTFPYDGVIQVPSE